ncbi:Transmembrane protein [Quillaja saponaria]|uniref:Transmembrane protein n=1 Tax=Quillaja saponaria TaxID=32244 RepID=A0AAD7QCU5_QUISA|nr:Transmembrane protein [Quillaja saponaria]
MSGGTPVAGGGVMRQRHSPNYASSGDELEDDACSRLHPLSPPSPSGRTWIEILESCLWLASAAFVVYFGDRRFNLIYLLWHDERIRRLPLYLGMIGVGVNVLIFIYTSILAWRVRRVDEKLELKKWEITSITALPFVTLCGLISFCLFAFSLWPIWSFLTLPLLFTLFMACMVIIPYCHNWDFPPKHL